MEKFKNVAPMDDFNWEAYENGAAETNLSKEELVIHVFVADSPQFIQITHPQIGIAHGGDLAVKRQCRNDKFQNFQRRGICRFDQFFQIF